MKDWNETLIEVSWRRFYAVVGAMKARRALLDESDRLLEVLDYVLDEQMAGRRPTTLTVANRFEVSIETAERWYQKLKDAGEFD